VASAAAPSPDDGDGKVAVRIDSTPSGAEVFQDGSETSLGTTPLATRLPRSGEPARFELRKQGFATVKQEARLDHDAYLSVGLAPVPTAPPVAASKSPGKTPVHKRPRSGKDRHKSDHTIEKGGVIDFE